MTFSDLQMAHKIMGLKERATLKELKARHRELVKQHHPDTGSNSKPEIIQKVNVAYRMLLEYVSDYRFSFAEEEFYEQNPEERIWMQFAYDPLCGKK